MKKLIFILFLMMSSINARSHFINVAVFCSGDNKVSQVFKQVAFNLGVQLGQHELGLTTGGSQTGLMKEVIDGYCSKTKHCNNLYGVIPQVFFRYNVHHPKIPSENLTWVESLHLRLKHFQELSDIIVILPGGFGTLHELMDFIVHNQLFAQKKRIIIFNMDHFWDALLAQFQTMKSHARLTEEHLNILEVVNDVDACMETILVTPATYHSQNVDSHFWEKK